MNGFKDFPYSNQTWNCLSICNIVILVKSHLVWTPCFASYNLATGYVWFLMLYRGRLQCIKSLLDTWVRGMIFVSNFALFSRPLFCFEIKWKEEWKLQQTLYTAHFLFILGSKNCTKCHWTHVFCRMCSRSLWGTLPGQVWDLLQQQQTLWQTDRRMSRG